MAYQGFTARLPIGLQGFSGSKNPSQMQPGHLTGAEGLSLEGGVLQKMGGASKLNSSALAGIAVSGINWSPVGATDRDIVFLSDGSVRKDTGAGTFGTTMVTGLTSVREPPPVFVPGGGETVGASRHLFLFSAVNQVHEATADGNTMQAISAPAADWSASFPTFGVQHAFRMWAGGNASDPHRMYASIPADHEDFVASGALSFAVYPAEGVGIVGAVSFRGVLVVFKYPRGIYIIDTRDPTVANWSVSKLSNAVGAVNHSSIVQIENDIMYLDEGGNIHLLSATNDFGDVNTSNISQIADLRPYIEANVNLAQIKRSVACWYSARRQAWFGLPSLGNADNGIRLVVDFNRPDVGPRFLPTERDDNVSLWMRPFSTGTSKPAAGDGDGFVWLLDRNERDKAGLAYQFRVETANTDLSFIDPSLATKMKNGQFLEIVSEPQGNWDLTVEVYWDDILADTILFNMGTGGAALGTFQLDVHALTSGVVASNRQRLVGSGRRLRLVISNGGVDQNISLADFLLGFTAGDERDKNTRGTEAA